MNSRKSISISRSGDLNLDNVQHFDHIFYLNSNNGIGRELLALGCINKLKAPTFNELEKFQKETQDWLFGYIAYDAKNQLENLKSSNQVGYHIPEIDFVQPELVIEFNTGTVVCHYDESWKESDVVTTINRLFIESNPEPLPEIDFEPRISKDEYLSSIRELKKEIQYGNIYEVNFCQQYTTQAQLFPYGLYHQLNSISPTPFSSFIKCGQFYTICASPERYLKKSGNKLISQPIKGTIKRHKDRILDKQLKQQLYHSKKDRQENVMIVDLVRNDLARCSKKSSVTVDELYGIYSFPQVHQMISTISSELDKGFGPVDALKNTFPMGSMTGAPKIKAMELIEKHESFKRELYSGSIGYFTPLGDFDFNVVIRSLFYSSKTQLLSFAVGGAITINSTPEGEYDETLLKAKAIFQLFS